MEQSAETEAVFDGQAGDGPSPVDPVAALARDHATQRALADLLEEVADGLPDAVDRGSAAHGADALRRLAARRRALEEQALFPLLERRAAVGSPVRRAIAVARREHREIAGRAIELAEELDALARDGRARNADAMGFMLRAFFDGLRRHLDWIDVMMIPAARPRAAPPGATERDSRPGDALFCERVMSGRPRAARL